MAGEWQRGVSGERGEGLGPAGAASRLSPAPGSSPRAKHEAPRGLPKVPEQESAGGRGWCQQCGRPWGLQGSLAAVSGAMGWRGTPTPTGDIGAVWLRCQGLRSTCLCGAAPLFPEQARLALSRRSSRSWSKGKSRIWGTPQLPPWEGARKPPAQVSGTPAPAAHPGVDPAGLWPGQEGGELVCQGRGGVKPDRSRHRGAGMQPRHLGSEQLPRERGGVGADLVLGQRGGCMPPWQLRCGREVTPRRWGSRAELCPAWAEVSAAPRLCPRAAQGQAPQLVGEMVCSGSDARLP